MNRPGRGEGHAPVHGGRPNLKAGDPCRALVPACLLSLAACGDGMPAGSTVRDSAGVAIVETPAAAVAVAPLWRLADSALLQIGDVEGHPARQFAGIEGVLRLADGRFVIADRGSAELRFFDERGEHLASYGGPGEAPGEYRQLSSLGSGPADSLWAFDFGLRRFTVLDSTGAAVRTVGVGPALAAVTAVGRLRDGSFVVREQWSAAAHATAQAGLVRDPAAVARLSGDGRTLDTITLVPGREVFIGSERGRAVMSAPLLARHAVAAAGGAQVVVGDQASFEIRGYDAQGALVRVIRVTGLDLALSADELRRAVDARIEAAPESERAMMRAHYSAMTVPPTRPAYGRLLLDDTGTLWVGSHEHAGPSRAWTVFGPDGALSATVLMPSGFDLQHVAGGLAIGTWRDALDVEYVRVYRVERSGHVPPR